MDRSIPKKLLYSLFPSEDGETFCTIFQLIAAPGYYTPTTRIISVCSAYEGNDHMNMEEVVGCLYQEDIDRLMVRTPALE